MLSATSAGARSHGTAVHPGRAGRRRRPGHLRRRDRPAHPGGVHETPRVYTALIFPELTERERQVLELVATGSDNHTIARDLALSEKTVRNHVSAISTKLHVRDRAAAVAKARDSGPGPR